MVLEEDPEIAVVVHEFFSTLFTASFPSSDDIERSIHVIQPVLNEDTNAQLLQRYSREEVYKALIQMGPFKSPRPDRFGVGFCQKYWDLVG